MFNVNHPVLSENGAGTLFLLLHGYNPNPQSFTTLANCIITNWPEAQIFCPNLPLSLLSTNEPNAIVLDLLQKIEETLQDTEQKGKPINNIILIGHSFGALLARKLYVVACGETAEAPFEHIFKEGQSHQRVPPRVWAKHVSRLILLAGINRGWHITHHLRPKAALEWFVGSAIGYMVHVFSFSRKTLSIMTIRQGAEFITQLRLQWIRMRQCESDAVIGKATTIQLLGSIDDIVAPEDNIDLVSGGDFIYIDVPYTGHANIVEMCDSRISAHCDRIQQQRWNILRTAISESVDSLAKRSVIPSDDKFLAPNLNIKKVVFVIHGIRDVGYWTHKIARKIKREAPNPDEWATETSSYGYFPMLGFLLPWYRRKKVEWLMDQYAEAVAKYPKAQFSYVGHSNGTYLLARALELYPCCKYEHVVFAGSVVRSTYDWQRFLGQQGTQQVQAVLNFVATADWVVAFFPKLFEFTRSQDIGSAGHDGFRLRVGSIEQIAYVEGGHGSAIKEPVWDEIAQFVIQGKMSIGDLKPRSQRNLCIWLVGLFPPIAWIVILGLVCVLWQIIWSSIGCLPIAYGSIQFIRGVLAPLYILLLWLILTRV